jgi:hypothetical protein
MDFASKPNKPLSFAFDNEVQDQMIFNTLEWLGTGQPARAGSGN